MSTTVDEIKKWLSRQITELTGIDRVAIFHVEGKIEMPLTNRRIGTDDESKIEAMATEFLEEARNWSGASMGVQTFILRSFSGDEIIEMKALKVDLGVVLAPQQGERWEGGIAAAMEAQNRYTLAVFSQMSHHTDRLLKSYERAHERDQVFAEKYHKIMLDRSDSDADIEQKKLEQHLQISKQEEEQRRKNQALDAVMPIFPLVAGKVARHLGAKFGLPNETNEEKEFLRTLLTSLNADQFAKLIDVLGPVAGGALYEKQQEFEREYQSAQAEREKKNHNNGSN